MNELKWIEMLCHLSYDAGNISTFLSCLNFQSFSWLQIAFRKLCFLLQDTQCAEREIIFVTFQTISLFLFTFRMKTHGVDVWISSTRIRLLHCLKRTRWRKLFIKRKQSSKFSQRAFRELLTFVFDKTLMYKFHIVK